MADTVSRSFFGQAAPTSTPRLLVGTVLSEEAADQPEEATSVLIRQQRRTGLETPAPNHGSKTATQHGYPRLCMYTSWTISICKLATGVVVMRSANPAEQGCGFSIAGYLIHFLPNLQAITSDGWELNTVIGYMINFLQKPYQHRRPRGVAMVCDRGFPAHIAHAHNLRTCSLANSWSASVKV